VFTDRSFPFEAHILKMDGMRIPMGDIEKIEVPGKLFETRREDQFQD